MPSAVDHPPKSSIPPSAMPLIAPNALLHAHLKQSLPTRPSGRSPSTARPIELNVGSLRHCNGSSLVKIGSTTVVCGVRAELLPLSDIPSFRITKTSSNYVSPPSGTDTVSPDGNYDEKEDEEEEEEEEREEKHSVIALYNLLVPNIELATGCSPNHPANTAPSVEAQSLSQRLLSLLHSSKLVRTKDLEIQYTSPSTSADLESSASVDQNLSTASQLKAYWVLYIDMVCISHGGSIFDSAWLALYAALRDTILPKAWWDADLSRILCSPDTSSARRLVLKGTPVPNSFAVFVPEIRTGKKPQQQQFWVLVDPDAFEEECCAERLCITVDVDEATNKTKILRIEKNGGGVVGLKEIQEGLKIAVKRCTEWRGVLKSALK